MKRIRLVLASLATLVTIILLSCGYLENPNSPAEDANFPEAPTLKKGSPSDEMQVALSSSSGSYVVLLSSSSRSFSGSPASMSVFIPVSGATVCSQEVTFPGTSSLISNAVLTKVQVKTGTLTYNGAVTTNTLKIRKGDSTPPNEVTILGSVAGGATITTDYFNGKLAKDTYYVSFCATCVGFGTSTFCSKSYSSVSLILSFNY